jgi:hypothetical protein
VSADIRTAAVAVLSPLVGKAMATVYVARAAMEEGKTSDTLSESDLDLFCDLIRRELRPFASSAMIEDAIIDIMTMVGH